VRQQQTRGRGCQQTAAREAPKNAGRMRLNRLKESGAVAADQDPAVVGGAVSKRQRGRLQKMLVGRG